MKHDELEKAGVACEALIARKQTLLISTYSDEHGSEISYAPFYRSENGVFYIYTSELASHTQNLLKQKQASILFIQDEGETKNLYARERASFNCRVEEVDRGQKDYESLLDQLQIKFGEVVSMLRSLPDFHLIALEPQAGQYVVGFGKAFMIDPKSRALSHIAGR